MKTLTKMGLAIGVLVFGFANVLCIYAATTVLNMKVNPGSVTIGAPTTLSFSNEVTASDQTQILEQSFSTASDYFYVQDLKGANNGYSTTLQVAGPLTDGVNTIAASNIAFKSTAGSATLLSGTTNPRVILDSNTSSYQDLSAARTFIVRNTANNAGVTSKYGSQVALKVSIPARQPVGDYATSMVFTLIES